MTSSDSSSYRRGGSGDAKNRQAKNTNVRFLLSGAVVTRREAVVSCHSMERFILLLRGAFKIILHMLRFAVTAVAAKIPTWNPTFRQPHVINDRNVIYSLSLSVFLSFFLFAPP